MIGLCPRPGPALALLCLLGAAACATSPEGPGPAAPLKQDAPPATKPVNRPAFLIKKDKLSGELPRLPDSVKVAYAGGTVLTTYKLCLSPQGEVTRVIRLQGPPGADEAITRVLRTWRFRQQPVPVCFFDAFQFVIEPLEEGDRAAQALASLDQQARAMEASHRLEPALPEDPAWAAAKLLSMSDLSSLLRSQDTTPQLLRLTPQERAAFVAGLSLRAQTVRALQLKDLQGLHALYPGFPRAVLKDGAVAAIGLLEDLAQVDPALPRQVLAAMEPRLPTREVEPVDYARLADRLELAAGRGQRFATQGHCRAGTWQPLRTVADPEHLDERRRDLGLPALAGACPPVPAAPGR